jgi:hypothetical protein
MAAIPHAFVAQNTPQDSSSNSYTDISGAVIANTSFTAGKKYLLVINAQLTQTDSGDLEEANIRTLHGTTPFAESEHVLQVGTANEYSPYFWFTVWTAVEGEGIKLQFASGIPGTGGEVRADQISLLAIQLSDNLTENTDWFFAERSNNDSLSTTPTDGASITFTPGTAGHDWLVLAYAQNAPGSATTRAIVGLVRSGEASSSLPQVRLEMASGEVESFIFPLARVFTLGAAENTFKEQSATSSGTAHTRLHSAIFALNLNKFKNHAFAYTEAAANLSASNYATELASISINPTTQSDVWIGAWWNFDKQATGREGEFRVQVDDADVPAGQTTDNRQFDQGTDATDENPLALSTMVTAMTTGAKTVALDASADSTTSTPTGQQRTLWAVTMELAAVGGDVTLTADKGALSLAGKTAAAQLQLLGAKGTVSLTAKSAVSQLQLLGAKGLISLSGGSAVFAETLLAEKTTLALTGKDATLSQLLAVVAEKATLALSGGSASFTETLLSAKGSLSLAGKDATFAQVFAFLAEKGALTLSGQPALFTDALLADKGTASLSGQTATTLLTALAEKGALTLSGEAAFVNILLAEPSPLNLIAKDAEFSQLVYLLAAKGLLTLSGNDATFTDIMLAEPSPLNLIPKDADFPLAVYLLAAKGLLTLSPHEAAFVDILTAEPSPLNLLAKDAEFSQLVYLLAAKGLLALSGNDATFTDIMLAEPSPLNLIPKDAEFSIAFVLDAEKGLIALTGNDAAFVHALAAAKGTLVLDGDDAAFLTALLAEKGAIVLAGADALFEGGEPLVLPDFTKRTVAAVRIAYAAAAILRANTGATITSETATDATVARPKAGAAIDKAHTDAELKDV